MSHSLEQQSVLPEVDSMAFRQVLGSFATGVTVVTALAPDGKWIGLTVSSFNTVSLTPPLILWSLSKSSLHLADFLAAKRYAVNVLSFQQKSLSDRFAAREEDRFAGVAVQEGLGGVPLLDACCASFECTNEHHYAGGDHLIFVGRVQRFSRGPSQSPLIFHDGSYRRLSL
ncbi:MAG: flavin reductase family protein [Pseudomonadota bacterium]